MPPPPFFPPKRSPGCRRGKRSGRRLHQSSLRADVNTSCMQRARLPAPPSLGRSFPYVAHALLGSRDQSRNIKIPASYLNRASERFVTSGSPPGAGRAPRSPVDSSSASESSLDSLPTRAEKSVGGDLSVLPGERELFKLHRRDTDKSARRAAALIIFPQVSLSITPGRRRAARRGFGPRDDTRCCRSAFPPVN